MDIDNWPRLVREALAAARERGEGFDMAWPAALDQHPPQSDDWRDVSRWAELHFRSAFEGTRTYRRGRFKPTVTDTTAEPLRERPHVQNPSGKCRVGGPGCELPATHGRFGSFCQEHANHLAGLDGIAHLEWTNAKAWPERDEEEK